MMMTINPKPLTIRDFAAFGDVLDCAGEPDFLINQGLCGRYHNRANLNFQDGAAGISLFKAKPRSLPYQLEMVERHPLGSQAFIPMSMCSFLIIVAHDNAGTPATPQAFVSAPGQAINLYKGVWHGVLTPLSEPGLFAVVDRIGEGSNLEEHWFNTPYTIEQS